MSQSVDYYRVLGVLDDAEDIVIRAAYRALAQRYHPDRWTGDITEAHRRMVEINEAYAVLSDPDKRRKYDLIGTSSASNADSVESAHHETSGYSGYKERAGRKTPYSETYQQQSHPEKTSESASTNNNKLFFLRRSWLMLLFVMALVMLLGAFPYVLISGEFKASYLAVVGFWFYVGHYAYNALFRP